MERAGLSERSDTKKALEIKKESLHSIPVNYTTSLFIFGGKKPGQFVRKLNTSDYIQK